MINFNKQETEVLEKIAKETQSSLDDKEFRTSFTMTIFGTNRAKALKSALIKIGIISKEITP